MEYTVNYRNLNRIINLFRKQNIDYEIGLNGNRYFVPLSAVSDSFILNEISYLEIDNYQYTKGYCFYILRNPPLGEIILNFRFHNWSTKNSRFNVNIRPNPPALRSSNRVKTGQGAKL